MASLLTSSHQLTRRINPRVGAFAGKMLIPHAKRLAARAACSRQVFLWVTVPESEWLTHGRHRLPLALIWIPSQASQATHTQALRGSTHKHLSVGLLWMHELHFAPPPRIPTFPLFTSKRFYGLNSGSMFRAWTGRPSSLGPLGALGLGRRLGRSSSGAAGPPSPGAPRATCCGPGAWSGAQAQERRGRSGGREDGRTGGGGGEGGSKVRKGGFLGGSKGSG